ncbi:putative zinc finger protein [Pisolithus orientalis]|uniref:putative zinc finger protein n=1 Tax=Pisolithus orientalis TaxID=936130 RepID=UPI00222522E4|nr:putative zinc finger protein [Pisolithus orientalis]KAI5996618.1 putative zinc finger protein [Pisolithus orientalis]
MFPRPSQKSFVLCSISLHPRIPTPMAKKKSKQVLRPWCWYCEREFEDEKVLMQHQKAKHFKCGMCPRRLNTAGGLAVHIQQVHKLEPENLPRIENALPGRDGYEVEIFDSKRRKEIELGLAAGSISQPQPKRPEIDNRPLSEDELRAQLEARFYNAAPTAYAVPPAPTPGITPLGTSPPPGLPGISPPPFMPGVLPPGPFPGVPPMASPFPGMPGFPPGYSSTPWFPYAASWSAPPPGMLPPGAPPFPPRVSRPPLPPPTFVPASSPSPVASMNGTPASAPPPGLVPPAATAPQPPAVSLPPPLVLPNPALEQKYGPFKKTDLKYADPNFSPEEKRGRTAKYYFASDATNTTPSQDQMASGTEEFRGKKRARAEDFL